MPQLHNQERLVRQFIDVVLNQRRLRELPDFISSDILEYQPFILSDDDAEGDFGRDLGRVLAAFADLRVHVDQVVNAPGRMALAMTLSGHNTGRLPWQAQPTLRHVQWSAMAMLRLDRGLISEIRGLADRHLLLRQLAGTPEPAAGLQRDRLAR